MCSVQHHYTWLHSIASIFSNHYRFYVSGVIGCIYILFNNIITNAKMINPRVCTKKIIATPRFFSILTCSNSQIQTHALQFHLYHPKLIFLSTLESLKGQKNRKKLKYRNFQAISRINNFT